MSLFNNRRRLEEDLERIRRANLPPERAAAEEQQEREERKKVRDELSGLGFSDFLAMVFAALSVVLPWLLVFVGVLALFYVIIF